MPEQDKNLLDPQSQEIVLFCATTLSARKAAAQ